MRKAILAMVVCGGLFVTFAGCGDGPSNHKFATTIVSVQADGKMSTKVIYETKEQMAAEFQSREQWRARQKAAAADGLGIAESAIGVDSGCDYRGMWLYDQGGAYGNRVCIRGAGTINLYYVYNPTYGNWSQQIRSWYGGDSAGYFWSDYCVYWGCTYIEYFSAWQYSSSADTTIASADYLELDSN